MHIVYWSRKNVAVLAAVVMLIVVVGIGARGFLSLPATTMPGGSEPIYRGNPDRQEVAFAVNVDWGEDILPEMLDTLDANGARATFFITGRFAAKFPEIVKEILARGHELANHGYSHPHVKDLGKAQNQEEITKTEEIILNLTGYKTTLFAPPYGEKERHVWEAAGEIGYRTVFWTVDTVDWKTESPQIIINRVMSRSENGAIVLMHPKSVTLQYLPELIRRLNDSGFKIKTVSEVLN